MGAFVLGAVLTAAVTEASKRFGLTQEGISAEQKVKQQEHSNGSIKGKSLEKLGSSLGKGAESIREGIEGCIGDTPLIKIKSLSDFTGCEILAKAEVRL